MTTAAPLRSDVGPLITYLTRGHLLRNGCTVAEAEAVTARPYAFAGVHPVLAVLYVRDRDGRERELHRVYDLDDLDEFIANGVSCQFLARSVRRLTAKEAA